MKSVWGYLAANWKTTICGLASFALSVQQFASALMTWQQGGKPDWRGAFVALIVAGIGLASKDATTHSTTAEVQNATAKENQK